jgi:hypothetical protein
MGFFKDKATDAAEQRHETARTAPRSADQLLDGSQVEWDWLSDAGTKDIRPEMRNA